tara:strand:+ start:11704 stop:14655 length:2952 start_codon:yes stop_codon:yes gene_type:complete
MKLYQITEIKGCPRTKASECSCKDLNKITEAEETVFAMAELEHGDAKGTIKFKQKPGEPTIITGTIKNLTEGTHGFHIHEFGDLSDGCDSAGGHYNPDGVDHGDLEEGHVGDLGNVEADKKGIAIIKIVAERVDLHGPRSVVGRAVVIHADEDDLGKGGDEESLKTGNAGDRVGCGVIRLAEKIDEEYERQLSDKHYNRNELPQIRRKHIKKSDFKYTEGKISIDKIKPVQSQRVDGLSKKAEDVFLKNADRPFIIDKKGYLINGHHRLDAANKLNIERVPAIKIHADIEEVIEEFKHLVSNTKVKEENKVTNLKTQKGGTKYPLFSKENIQKAYNEYANGAEVDRDIEIVGNDKKLYVIRQNYDGQSQHFEEGEWYLTDANNNIVNTEGYPDPGELLYDHQADEEFYPKDPDEIDENQDQSLPPEVKEFVNKLTPTDVGKDTVGKYIIHYEGFTDECNDGHDDNSIDDVYADVYRDFDSRQGQKALIRGVANDELGCGNNPVLYSVYKNVNENKRNLNPDVKDYVKGKKTKFIKVKVADLDDDAIDDRFGRVIDVDPDVGVDLDKPILIDIDGKTILDGFHRVYQAKRVGIKVIPAEIIDENVFKVGALAAMLGMSASALAQKDIVSDFNDKVESTLQYYEQNPNSADRNKLENEQLKAALRYVGNFSAETSEINMPEDEKELLYNLRKLFLNPEFFKDQELMKEKPKWNLTIERLKANNTAKMVFLAVKKKEKEVESEQKGEVEENFADGKKKGKSRPGRVKRSGASCKGSVTSLRAKAKKYSGERAKMYHWCANMKSGRKKTKENLDLDSNLQGLDRSSKMFKNMVDDKIKSKQIKDMDGIIGYVAQARMAGIITYKEDARDLLQYYHKNKEKIFPQNHLDEIVDPGKTTEVSFNGIRSHIASQYGERYGINMDNLEFAFDDDFQMTNLGYDEAYIKDNDMAILNNFLKQLPVEFEVVDMRFDDNKDPVFKLAHKQVTRH